MLAYYDPLSTADGRNPTLTIAPVVYSTLFWGLQGFMLGNLSERANILLLMDKILHDLKDSKLWELWYVPYVGSINSILSG